VRCRIASEVEEVKEEEEEGRKELLEVAERV